jgi:hypothetical protein
MVATAFIANHRSGSEAFAQVTGGERRIVATGVYGAAFEQNGAGSQHWAYRVWSDNAVEVKFLGTTGETYANDSGGLLITRLVQAPQVCGNCRVEGVWQTVDTGSPTFMSTDVDRTGQVDSGDIAQVLLDFNTTTDPTTPPPIDCTINAPR